MVKEVIYGIGPNPMEEQYREEDMECSSFVVYICDKKTWEEKHCCSSSVDKEIIKELKEAGFEEVTSAVFTTIASCYPKLTIDELRKMIERLGFVHNEDFETYMISAFE